GADSGETYEKRNPMRPDEVVADVPACGKGDVDAAAAAAAEAFPAWSATPAPQRGNLLVKAAEVIEARLEQIAIEMTREMGKPLPALAYGNTVVLKLATEAPVTGLRLAECLAEAGLPAGVLNVLTGSGSKVGNPLVRDPRVRAISFTGSVPVGRSVREEATKLGKRVQLELGGQNPLIVLSDAKLEAAVEAAYAGAFWSAGQKCTATRRIYVHEPVYDAFLSCEEVFGPVTSLYRIDDLEEGLRRANAVEFGLSAAIFTQSLEAAQRFTTEAEAGLLHVNSQTAGAEVHVPFGGIKASGF